jgi:hypothetical protein
MMEIGVRGLTTDRVHAGTRPAVSLHQRSTVKGMIGMTRTCAMSSVVEMHVARLKTGAKSESTLSKSGTARGTMITMILSMTNHTNKAPLKEGEMQGESKSFSMT